MNAFFSYPVTDSIAPGYSSIIKEPMDFSTMKSKIDNAEYNSIIEYRVQFRFFPCRDFCKTDVSSYRNCRFDVHSEINTYPPPFF